MPHSPLPTDSLSPEQQALLESRYGLRNRPGWPLLTAIVLTAALFAGWVIWAAVGRADQDVRWRTVGYSEVSNESVTLEFDVFKPADQDVVCLVRALDIDSREVGRAEVPVSVEEADVNVIYDLHVTDRPNTAEVVACRLDSPPAA